MATLKGTVSQLEVYETFAWARIEEASSGDIEKVTVWSEAEDYSPQQRLVHGIWMSILREALVNRLTVEVYHPDDSSLVTSVHVFS